MSAAKRRAVYDLARKYDILIIEDNPYGDLRYRGEDVPGIKTLDEDGRVIYVGSFSKVISPGLRVGYTVCPDPVLRKMVVAKQGGGRAHQYPCPDDLPCLYDRVRF